MNMKTVERYGHAAEASDEVLNPSGSPVHIGTVCEISHELLARTFMLAAVAAVARLAPMSVTLVAAADRPSMSATAIAPPRRRASMPSCASAQQRLSLSLSLSLYVRTRYISVELYL